MEAADPMVEYAVVLTAAQVAARVAASVVGMQEVAVVLTAAETEEQVGTVAKVAAVGNQEDAREAHKEGGCMAGTAGEAVLEEAVRAGTLVVERQVVSKVVVAEVVMAEVVVAEVVVVATQVDNRPDVRSALSKICSKTRIGTLSPPCSCQ